MLSRLDIRQLSLQQPIRISVCPVSIGLSSVLLNQPLSNFLHPSLPIHMKSWSVCLPSNLVQQYPSVLPLTVLYSSIPLYFHSRSFSLQLWLDTKAYHSLSFNSLSLVQILFFIHLLLLELWNFLVPIKSGFCSLHNPTLENPNLDCPGHHSITKQWFLSLISYIKQIPSIWDCGQSLSCIGEYSRQTAAAV